MILTHRQCWKNHCYRCLKKKRLLNVRILALILKHSIHYFSFKSGENILLYIKERVRDSEKKRNAEKLLSKKAYLIK